MDRDLTTFGRAIASAQDRTSRLPAGSLDERLAGVRAARRSGRRHVGKERRLALGFALAASLALVAIFVSRLFSPSTTTSGALAFSVGEAREPGIVGAWIAASSSAELPIRFSDGTALRLAPDARVRVVASSSAGANVAIERGRLGVDVVHRPVNDWNVIVGPFDVHVTGTRFDATWEPVDEVFTLVMHEGKVRVTAPCLTDPRSVVTGETLRLTCRRDSDASAAPPVVAPEDPARANDESPPTAAPSIVLPEVAPAFPPSAAPNAAHPTARIDETPLEPKTPVEPKAPAAADAGTGSGWRRLAINGDYAGSLAVAELDGFDAICASEEPHDVLLLGETARLAGKPLRAARAYEAVRDRAPGSADAAFAAFQLGRLAFAERGREEEARRWLSTYLHERTDGPFVEEALGRLLECDLRLGDEASAHTTALLYLKHYPKGPHAALAAKHASP